tara:strand:+ start:14707 stop:16023 length:1317 start_codon:yes stop_codon:yes gene_type:complete
MIENINNKFDLNKMLEEWFLNLELTNLEKIKYKNLIDYLRHQLTNLQEKNFYIGAVGPSGSGKSSILNSLIKNNYFETNVLNGSTSKVSTTEIKASYNNLQKIFLVDTPGVDTVKELISDNSLLRKIYSLDLVLFVISKDIDREEIKLLNLISRKGKKIILILNKTDHWNKKELQQISNNIKSKLRNIDQFWFTSTAASPHISGIENKKLIKYISSISDIKNLEILLSEILNSVGEELIILKTFQVAERFFSMIKKGRLKRRKEKAQTIIGKFAAIKASTLAANPFLMIDIAGGIALDTALIMELSKLYGLNIKGKSAKILLKKLSISNLYLGSWQIFINLLFNFSKSLILITTPFNGGLSIASTGPIAIAQAALAIKSTKMIGKLAAQEMLTNSQNKIINLQSFLKKFAKSNPELNECINEFLDVQRNIPNSSSLIP